MELIQIMRRGPDKVLAMESWNSATMEPKPRDRKQGFINACSKICIWFQIREPDYFGSSRYRVEMDRGDALELRDYLNRMFSEESES